LIRIKFGWGVYEVYGEFGKRTILACYRPKRIMKTKRIFVMCPFPQGVAAGQRLKYEQYFDHWRENG